MSRQDISPYLVHFTSGASYEEAFVRLCKILTDRKLIAGSQYIKGKYCCVCFSEAPPSSLGDGLVNESSYSRYSPFGILVSKQWLYSLGGRPVIYESDQEYDQLPESHRWRHVLFELRERFGQTDFTWEREWRIRCDHLAFDQRSASIVVLDQSWADRLVREHDSEQDYLVRQYELIFDEPADDYRNAFSWKVWTLKQSG